jgi:hypothetical protein
MIAECYVKMIYDPASIIFLSYWSKLHIPSLNDYIMMVMKQEEDQILLVYLDEL